MSTNALVGVEGNDGWTATYVHWDGYQLHKEIVPILKRDGLVKTLDTLFSHTWSSLQAGTPTQEEIDAVEPDDTAYGTPSYHRYLQSKNMEAPENLVPGYGTCHSDPFEPSTPSNFVGYPEYLYLIDNHQVKCYDFNDEDNPKLLRVILWNDVQPDLSDFEQEE